MHRLKTKSEYTRRNVGRSKRANWKKETRNASERMRTR
jgi:hypothetical protein